MNCDFRPVSISKARPSVDTVEDSLMLEDSMDFSGAQAMMNDCSTPSMAMGSMHPSCKQICDRPEHFDKYV